MAGLPQQMDSKALMQSVNSISPAANPQTPKERMDHDEARSTHYRSAQAALKKVSESGWEPDPDNQQIVDLMRITLGNLYKNAAPGFVKEQFLRQVGSFGGPASGGGGVPGQPPSPGMGIAGVGMGPGGQPPGPQAVPTAQPPPMVG